MDKYTKAVKEARKAAAQGRPLLYQWFDGTPKLLFGNLPRMPCCLTQIYAGIDEEEYINQHKEIVDLIRSDKRLQAMVERTQPQYPTDSDLEIFADIRRRVDPMLEEVNQ